MRSDQHTTLPSIISNDVTTDQTTINDLPDELIQLILAYSKGTGSCANHRFFSLGFANRTDLAHQYFERVISGQITLSSNEEAIWNLRLLAASAIHFKRKFEDERVKLARIGLLMLECLQTLCYFTKTGIAKFNLAKYEKVYTYICQGHYQFIETVIPTPISDNDINQFIPKTLIFINTINNTKSNSLEELFKNAVKLYADLQFTADNAQKNLVYLFLSLIHSSEQESETDKIHRLLNHFVSHITETLHEINPHKKLSYR